jgi:hypothetical protein
MVAEVHSLADARARSASSITLDAELAIALAELCVQVDAEEGLPQARLTQEALLALRNQVVPVMGAGGRALVPVEALYAMARELLDSRVELRTVKGSWESYELGRVSREDFESDVSCVAELAGADAARETLECSLTIETSGGAT